MNKNLHHLPMWSNEKMTGTLLKTIPILSVFTVNSTIYITIFERGEGSLSIQYTSLLIKER